MTGLLIIIVLILLIGGGIWGWPLLAGLLGIASVTDKESALKQITQLMNTYHISPSEVGNAYQHQALFTPESPARTKGDIVKTLFGYLGGIFILAGLGTYIGMFWESIGSLMRILVTLGVGYLLLIVLISALHENRFPRLILPLTFAATIMMTSGWFVLIHELFPRGDDWRIAALLIFSVMALQFGLLFLKYHRTALLFTTLLFSYSFLEVGLDMLSLPFGYIAIILGSSLFLTATALEKTAHACLSEPALLIGVCWLNSGLFDQIELYTSANWATLVIGLCLSLTAYGLHQVNRYPRLIALGYFVGSLMFYTALFDLLQHSPAELLFIAASAAGLYCCVAVQSRALLITSVIAMLGFIVYFSEQYFADSLGWPITLMLIGVAFLGVGATAIKIRQKI